MTANGMRNAARSGLATGLVGQALRPGRGDTTSCCGGRVGCSPLAKCVKCANNACIKCANARKVFDMPASIQVSARMQRLMGAQNGYVVEAAEPTTPKSLIGLFAFGDSPSEARQALARTVWEHLEFTGELPADADGMAMVVPVTTWFPRHTLTAGTEPRPANTDMRPHRAPGADTDIHGGADR